jgi:hypothetical protein
MPDCISDASYRALIKDPLRWLQREMGGTYTSRFQHPDAVKQEAQRIFDVAVRRWYGEDAPAQHDFWAVSYEERVWSDEGAVPWPASSADLVNLKNATRLRREADNRKRYLKAWKAYGKEAHNIVKDALGYPRKPKVVGMFNSTTLTWGLGAASISITALRDDIFIVVEVAWNVVREEDFSIESFKKSVRWAIDFSQ